MKKFLLAAVIFSLISQRVLAVTSTSSATETTLTPTPVTQKIQDLKDRLATFAASQKQTEMKAIFGTVKSTSISNFVVETDTKDIKIDLADNLKVAQVINAKRTELTTDDISKGDVVTVFGEYDSSIDLIKAKAVYIQSNPPIRIIGVVTAVDRNGYTETLTTADNQSYVVDIETDTRTTSWSPAKGIFKSGFSKTEAGNFVQIIAVPEPKQPPTRVSARRILDLGNLTGATTAASPTPATTPTGGATPSGTPKISPKPTSSS